MPAAELCPKCGKKVKSERHVCQPSAVDKMERVRDWKAQHEPEDEDEED